MAAAKQIEHALRGERRRCGPPNFRLGGRAEVGDTDLIFNDPLDVRTQDHFTGRFG